MVDFSIMLPPVEAHLHHSSGSVGFDSYRHERNEDQSRPGITDLIAPFSDDSETEQIYEVPGAWTTQRNDFSDLLAYRYEPLPPGPWIRVLRLEPGMIGDQVQASLRPMLLEDACGQYDALSYVWGSESPSFTIEVDGKYVRVRKNLFDFLQKLRSEKEARIFWADALCIDQQSIDERSHQVQMMQSIYRYSQTTRVWLGVLGDASVLLRWSPSERLFLYTSDPMTHAIRRGLTEILAAPYWTRLWIIQEVTLSSEIEVYVSERSLSWSNFVRLCKQGAAELGHNDKLVKKFSKSTMLSLHRQRTDRTERSLPGLLRSYRRSLCFDLRDRVFGLLGLVDNFEINVDYNLSTRELFERVMQSHPIQFAEDLGEHLSAALELASQEISSTIAQHSPSAIPIRVRECGSVMQNAGKLVWDQHLNQIMTSASYLAGAITEGDSLYSFSATPLAAFRGKARFLLVLRRKGDLHGCGRQSQDPQTIVYNVAGVALVSHPLDEISKVSDFGSSRYLKDGRALRRRNLHSFGFGPITAEIQSTDFLALGQTYGFGQSDQVPYYDAITQRPYQGIVKVDVSRQDDDEDQQAIALSVVCEGMA